MAKISIGQLLGSLGGLQLVVSSPWAILRVQFSDQNDTDWPPTSKYDDLFTSAGSGKMNMVDFFSDMSHGKLDLSGSKVFGPFKIPYQRSDYVGRIPNPTPGKLNADGLKDVARTAATNARVSLSDYAGSCLTFIGHVDLFGGRGDINVFCDTFSLSPSLLGQEMGHGYGLDHARMYGSAQDYQDPWDVMSTANAFMAPHSEFTNVGPGLNAWNMRSRGWLDETRVWTSPLASFDDVVQLRPLHRTDLPGFLAAQVQSYAAQVATYLVEFRVPQRWDAAIPRACVLVHSFLNNHSYLMYSYTGSRDIVEGDKFAIGDPNYPDFGYCAAEVLEIDVPNLTATVRLHQRPRRTVPIIPQAVGQISGGVALDEGGTIMVGGKVIKVPVHGPALELVEEVARYLEIDISPNNVGIALAARREALEAVVRAVISLYADARPISEPPPGYMQDGRNP